jgi:NTE family protein
MRVVLVLGGGGAKAIAHVGAWTALRELGADIVHIVGTSMGAVIGAALAAGSTAEQMMQVAGSLKRKDVASLDLLALVKGVFATSILKSAALRRTIARFVSAQTFAELRIPLTVTATDIDSGELVLFGARGRDAPLQAVLCASCALPLYFPPTTIDGRSFADGGLRAVLPLSAATAIPADLVVAVDVGSGFDEPMPPATARSRLLPPRLIRAHDDAIRIMMAAQTQQAIKHWPHTARRLVVVRAVAEREATFALGQADRYFRAGYDATKQALGVYPIPTPLTV